MTVLTTQRLRLREFTLEDAPFVLVLLNEPSFLQFIGDKGVRTLTDARNYILSGPMASYKQHSFGLYLTQLKESETSIGMCGLVKRDGLTDVDVGFAFLPTFWGKGYATEAASGVMAYGYEVLGLKRIVGITAVNNHASMHVLEKLGLRFEKIITLPPHEDESKLFK